MRVSGLEQVQRIEGGVEPYCEITSSLVCAVSNIVLFMEVAVQVAVTWNKKEHH